MNETKNVKVNVNVGSIFVTLLTILFIALKLIGVISWSWLWVLSPLWISALLLIPIIIIAVVLWIIANKR
jgi:hypothetical protein